MKYEKNLSFPYNYHYFNATFYLLIIFISSVPWSLGWSSKRRPINFKDERNILTTNYLCWWYYIANARPTRIQFLPILFKWTKVMPGNKGNFNFLPEIFASCFKMWYLKPRLLFPLSFHYHRHTCYIIQSKHSCLLDF